MDLHEAYEAYRAEISRQVMDAAESLPADEPFSLSTFTTLRENGSLTIRQPTGAVTLTESQVRELMNRIAVKVLRAQAEAML